MASAVGRMMKSKLSTKASLELELGSSVEEGLQKKKKKEDKDKRNKKSSEGCHIKRRKAKKKKKKRDVSVDDHARNGERPQPSAQGEQQ